MAENISYYWKTQISRDTGLEYYVLGYYCESKPEHSIEAWIVPKMGSNMCKLSINGIDIISFSELLFYDEGEFTGTPVLYPTPNRVRNGVFTYCNTEYKQIKNGRTIFEHGLVYNENWEYSMPETRHNGVLMKTWIDFDEYLPYFSSFPFHHRLELEFHLHIKGVKISYTIINKDNKDIPFGFGLHPYFSKLCKGSDPFIVIPADYVMKTTSDLLPTGELTTVSHTTFDLNKPIVVDSLDLDHVYTGIHKGQSAEVLYKSLGIKVVLAATDDFSHIVLYSARGEDYFCVENYTCSTDAHNLYNKGFNQQSGLKFVPAGTSHTGHVNYIIMQAQNNE